MSELIERLYLPHVAAARAHARADTDALLEQLRPQHGHGRAAGDAAVLGFLIEFCARGVRMLRPVEGWMRRSGEACVDAGFAELGVTLLTASRGESQRHLSLIDDLVQLAELWRGRFGRALDLGALVRREPPEAAQRHASIRAHASGPEQPYLTLGIELELAALALGLGPKLMRRCEDQLGSTVFAGLHFVQARTEHAALYSDTWCEHLEALLRVCPEHAPAIAVVGSEALAAMVEFSRDCVGQWSNWSNDLATFAVADAI